MHAAGAVGAREGALRLGEHGEHGACLESKRVSLFPPHKSNGEGTPPKVLPSWAIWALSPQVGGAALEHAAWKHILQSVKRTMRDRAANGRPRHLWIRLHCTDSRENADHTDLWHMLHDAGDRFMCARN